MLPSLPRATIAALDGLTSRLSSLAVALVFHCCAMADRARAEPGYALPVSDRGIYAELNAKVRLHRPSWLAAGPSVLIETRDRRVTLIYVAGRPVAFAPGHPGKPLVVDSLGTNDHDGDGIPDALDLLVGAKKTVLNGAVYSEGYVELPYPLGDLPRTRGVCTDVVIRALRNAGIDLQQRVHQDIRRRRQAYPMVRRPNRSIDHRRVRTLLPYFSRHFARPEDELFLPGDIVLMNTLGDSRPDHIGIISDRLGPSGRPLVINNWTVGHRTAEMDLLSSVPVTDRFRVPARSLKLPASQRGLAGLLRRHGLTLPQGHQQLLVVTAPLWSSSSGRLQRFARTSRRARWRAEGRSIPVQLGAAGLGRGLGLHDQMLGGPEKREGDQRSPAGIFALGPAFGRTKSRPYGPGRWPWRQTDSRDRLVDDPRSPLYNTWQRAPAAGPPPWRSSEQLSSYRLGLVVEHNTRAPIQPGAGSAIFLHTTTAPTTLGCTTMEQQALTRLLRWLRPDARPLLLQLPGETF